MQVGGRRQTRSLAVKSWKEVHVSSICNLEAGKITWISVLAMGTTAIRESRAGSPEDRETEAAITRMLDFLNWIYFHVLIWLLYLFNNFIILHPNLNKNLYHITLYQEIKRQSKAQADLFNWWGFQIFFFNLVIASWIYLIDSIFIF